MWIKVIDGVSTASSTLPEGINATLDTDLSPLGWYALEYSPLPEYDQATEVLVDITVGNAAEIVNGKVVQQWNVVPNPNPQPDWKNFNTELLSDPLWVSWGLNSDLRMAIISTSATGNLPGLQIAYDIAKSLTPPPPPGAIEVWTEIAERNKVGLIF